MSASGDGRLMDVIRYYESIDEPGRLTRGRDRLELLRVQEIVRRLAPPPPSRVLDVGGGGGAHAEWLSEDGYAVHLVDPVPIAYFHAAGEAELEAEEVGYDTLGTHGVEGPGWLVPDFDARWDDPALRAEMLDRARATELAAELAGIHAHVIVAATPRAAPRS